MDAVHLWARIMNRRSFVTRIAKAFVIATAAPTIVAESIRRSLPTHKPPLDLQEFLATTYRLARQRRGQTIDIWVDSAYAAEFLAGCIRYYKDHA